MSYEIRLSSEAAKDWSYLQSLGETHTLRQQALRLHAVLSHNPWQNTPPFKKLQGPLTGYVARRLNMRHRLVYQVHESERQVFVLRILAHHGLVY